MKRWMVIFFTLTVVSGYLGFGSVAVAETASFAKIFFFVFIVMFILALVAQISTGPPRDTY